MGKTCRLDTEIRVSGSCPWCGMDLDPDLPGLLNDRVHDEDSFNCPVVVGGCDRPIRLSVSISVDLRKARR